MVCCMQKIGECVTTLRFASKEDRKQDEHIDHAPFSLVI